MRWSQDDQEDSFRGPGRHGHHNELSTAGSIYRLSLRVGRGAARGKRGGFDFDDQSGRKSVPGVGCGKRVTDVMSANLVLRDQQVDGDS